MNLDFIIIANCINFVGALFLLTGHFYVSKHHYQNGFKYSAIGSFIICNGSFILESWPVLFLDFSWVLLSLYGLFYMKHKAPNKYFQKTTLIFITMVIITILFILIIFQKWDEMGWLTSVIYLSVYYLLSTKRITLKFYLFAYIAGFLILIPHVLLHYSYSVLLSETIAASICFYRIVFYK